jgi:hypothetical protein
VEWWLLHELCLFVLHQVCSLSGVSGAHCVICGRMILHAAAASLVRCVGMCVAALHWT